MKREEISPQGLWGRGFGMNIAQEVRRFRSVNADISARSLCLGILTGWRPPRPEGREPVTPLKAYTIKFYLLSYPFFLIQTLTFIYFIFFNVSRDLKGNPRWLRKTGAVCKVGNTLSQPECRMIPFVTSL